MKKNLNYLMIVSLAFLNSACSTTNIQTKPVERIHLSLENPESLKLKQVEFHVLTSANSSSVMSELKGNGQEEVLFCLSGNDYKDLSMNVEDVKNFLIKQGTILKLYQAFYEQGEKLD